MKKSDLIPYPECIQAALGMDGRHHAVPLMVTDKRWDDEENQPYHPRIGSITHGRGHTDQFNAEHLAMEIAVRYNAYPRLIAALEKLSRLGNGNLPGNSEGNCIAQDALNSSRDSDAN